MKWRKIKINTMTTELTEQIIDEIEIIFMDPTEKFMYILYLFLIFYQLI